MSRVPAQTPKNVLGGGYGRSERKGFWGAIQKVSWSGGRKSVKESLFLSSADYQVKRSLLASKHWLRPRAEPFIKIISPSSGDILWVWPIMNVHVPEPVLNHINCKNLHKNYCIHCWVGHHWRRPRQGSKKFIASWSITAELHPS